MKKVCLVILCMLLFQGKALGQDRVAGLKKYNVYMGPFKKHQMPRVEAILKKRGVRHKIIGNNRVLLYRGGNRPTRYFFQNLYKRLGSIKKFVKKRITYQKIRADKSKGMAHKKHVEGSSTTSAIFSLDLSGFVKVFPQYHYKQDQFLLPLVLELKKNTDLSESLILSTGIFSAVDLSRTSSNFIDTRGFNLSYGWNLAKITAGAQVLSWGRVFENSILSGFNREFLKYGPQLNLGERSLDQWALRAEIYHDDLKIDAVVVPYFRAHEFSEEGEPWALFSKGRGEFILGPDSKQNPIFSQLVGLSSLGEIENNDVGWGLRTTKEGSLFSWGATVYQAPSLNPYFSVNPQTLALLNLGQTPEEAVSNTSGAEFFANYPMLTTAALDSLYQSSIGSFRLEIGYEKGTPMTSTNFEYLKRSSIKWNIGFETFFRQDQDRLNLLLSGTNLKNDRDILEFKDQYYLTVQYSMPLGLSTFELKPSVTLGLHAQDQTYRFMGSYNGIDNQTLAISMNHYRGEPFTYGAFLETYSFASISWNLFF